MAIPGTFAIAAAALGLYSLTQGDYAFTVLFAVLGSIHYTTWIKARRARGRGSG